MDMKADRLRQSGQRQGAPQYGVSWGCHGGWDPSRQHGSLPGVCRSHDGPCWEDWAFQAGGWEPLGRESSGESCSWAVESFKC